MTIRGSEQQRGPSPAPTTLDGELFKSTMAEMPAVVTVVTCWSAEGVPVGATLSSVGSLSLDPPLMFAAFSRKSQTLQSLAAPGAPFIIHILAEGQEHLARRFAGKGAGKFADIDWDHAPDGPEFGDCCCAIACRVHDLMPCGDHIIVAGAVQRIRRGSLRQPLLYHRREIYPVPARQEISQ